MQLCAWGVELSVTEVLKSGTQSRVGVALSTKLLSYSDWWATCLAAIDPELKVALLSRFPSEQNEFLGMDM